MNNSRFTQLIYSDERARLWHPVGNRFHRRIKKSLELVQQFVICSILSASAGRSTGRVGRKQQRSDRILTPLPPPIPPTESVAGFHRVGFFENSIARPS